MSNELDAVRENFRVLIVGTCNAIGCAKCPYKWDDGCSSDEFMRRIDVLEKELDNVS